MDRRYYRSREEEEEWRAQRDPVKLAGDWITAAGLAPASALDRIDEEVQEQVRSALAFALEAPYPEPSEVTEDVYA